MDGDTPLMMAAANGHLGVVNQLVDAGADLDVTSDRGRTALHMAVWNNRYRIAQRLLLLECALNVRECYGDTPLMLAARKGHTQILRLLLDHGCPPDACNDELDTALHYAAWYGHSECLQLLLSTCCIDLEWRNIWGITPLLYAVQFGKEDCTRVLIHAGADVNALDMGQRTPLHHACKKKAVDCAKLLVRHGAALNVSDQDAATPLMDAISVNCAAVVQILIQGGCNVDIVGKVTVRGRYIWSTPFKAALQNGYFVCARMLYSAGCPLGKAFDDEEDDDDEVFSKRGTKDILDCNDWVEEVYRVPRSLSIWCRAAIHKSLGRQATSKVKQLPLPKGMQLYVAYYDLGLIAD